MGTLCLGSGAFLLALVTPSAVLAAPPQPAHAPGEERPPGSEAAEVEANTQASLRKIVGDHDWKWESPRGLLPEELLGWSHVSGPNDPDLPPKSGWRKSLVWSHDATGVEARLNCYRKKPRSEDGPRGARAGAPYAPLREPDYGYEPIEFHDLPAADAHWEVEGSPRRQLLVFAADDLLFKIECRGDVSRDVIRESAYSVAESVRDFHKNSARHRK